MADLVVGETTCDGKKKMYELMAETRPVYVLELPQKADDPDAFDHWYAELMKFREFLEYRFEVTITDAKLREAIGVMNRERALRRDLAGLMKAEVPPLTGRQLLSLKSSISGLPDDFAHYEEVLRHYFRTVGRDSTAPRLRVLLTGVPIGHRLRSRAGHRRGVRRPDGRHGELYGAEADHGGR